MAELLGEMRVEAAVPALGSLLGHNGTAGPAGGGCRSRADRDGGHRGAAAPPRCARARPEFRGLIAASVGGTHARALALPLVSIAEGEESGDVQAELFRALGRIGTAEAVEALVRAAQPGGRLFGRRPSGPRVAAVEGLQSAGGAVARKALRELAEDGEKVVRRPALRALAVGSAAAPAEPGT